MSDGLADILNNFNKALSNIEKLTVNGLASVANDLLSESVKICPKDTGTLRASGFANINNIPIASSDKDGNVTSTGITIASNTPTATIGYTEKYAHRQHEETGWSHPSKKNIKKGIEVQSNGQAKYLEKPFRQNAKMYIDKLAKEAGRGCDV